MPDALRAIHRTWGLVGGIACIALVMLMAGEARADAIGDGPEDCPEGSSPTACHGAEYCRADVCVTDKNCSDGEVCRDAMMCVHKDVCFGGSGSSTPVEGLVKGCRSAADCGEDSCEARKLCVSPEEPTTGNATGGSGSSGGAGSSDTGDGEKKGGCGCRSEGEPATGLLAAGLLGLTLVRRRRG